MTLAILEKSNYNVIMKAKIIKIGNSKGIRIPKTILEQCDFGDEVELEIKDQELIIKSKKHPRDGWAEAIDKAGPLDDDELLEGWDFPNEFDEKEWVWE